LFTVGFGVRFTNIQLIHCFASRCHLIIKKQKENAFSKGRTVQKLFAESLFKGGIAMSAFSWKSNGKLYGKLLFTTSLCIALTLLVSSLFYFFAYMQLDLRKTYQSDASNLAQTSKEVISMTENAQSLSFQIYRSFAITKLMFYSEPSYYDVRIAMNELDNYLNSMSYIESIYVYNSASDLFYTARRQGQGGTLSRAELEDQGILDILDQFQSYRPFTPIPRTYTTELLDGERTTRAYTYLGYDAIGKSNQINSAVIINISAAWINRDIGAAVKPKGAKSYIMDNQNQLLSGDTLEPAQLDINDLALLERKVDNQPSGYIVADFQGRKSFISYTAPDALEWQYVRVTPYNEITAGTTSIVNRTIWIAAGILAGGLFVSWLLSHMLYKPIRLMESQMNMLENERRNTSYTIRQSWLRGLMQGSKKLQTPAQMQRMAQSGITFDFQAGYRVVLIRIDRFAHLKETRGDDLLPYRFAIMNISGEISARYFKAETVDMEEDSVVLLLSPLEDEGALGEQELLKELLNQIQQSAWDFLKLGLSITYSREGEGAEQLPLLYKEAREASMHRLFYGHGCIIDAESVTALKANDYVFPLEREKKLTDALMTGKTDEAKRLLSDILKETSAYSFHVVRMTSAHLSMTVNNHLATIQKNNNLDMNGIGYLHLPSLDQVETMKEIEDAFYEMFDALQEKLSVKRSSRHEELIARINKRISELYADSALSLNSIAEEMGMSPIYLSRLYKQYALTPIVDAINQVRMEAAKQYLEQSDMPVVDIAPQCGYTSSSYFHRMFKKSFGVTPADYRKMKAQPDNSTRPTAEA
jgi:two-component system, response regulator YesN